MLIEGYSFKDALYMTIITVTTVGFGLIQPLSPAGTYFTVLLIVTSFILIAFVIQNIISILIDTDLRLFIKHLRMEKLVKRLHDHVVVCGYGKNGHHAVEELLLHGEVVVVVEKEHTVIAQHEFHKKENLYFIEGDATQDEILQAANVQNARALIAALPVDADNVFVVLTARELNPKMLIISRASDEQSDSKLRRAGADYVIMPDHIGGHRMGKLVSQPDVLEFLDYIMVKSGNSVSIESIPCEQLPREYIGKTIGQLDIRRKTGANVIGLKLFNGTYIFNPSPDERIEPGGRLFVLGTPEQIEKLIKLYKN
jgi:voltage-gated potassium channel